MLDFESKASYAVAVMIVDTTVGATLDAVSTIYILQVTDVDEIPNDFSGDGKAGILWQNDTGTPAVWLMDGLTRTSAALLPDPGSSWHAVEAFDMNADGKAAILWQNDTGTPALWFIDGATMTSAALLPNPTAEWRLI